MDFKDKRIGVYLRQSNGQSMIDGHKEKVETIFESQGVKAYRFYIDADASGATTNRQGLKSMLGDAKLNKFDTVLTVSDSMLFRTVEVYNEVAEILNQSDIAAYEIINSIPSKIDLSLDEELDLAASLGKMITE